MQRADRSSSSANSAPLLRLAARGVAGGIVDVAVVVDTRQQLAEHLYVAADAADRHAAEVDAVIARSRPIRQVRCASPRVLR